MHMISKKDLSDAEMDTLTKSCSPKIVITANGEVQTHEEATVYVKELDIFLTMKVLENTPAVLSLGKLCDENGYSYEWINGQKPHLIKDGIRIICNTENFVPIVVHGLSSSSSASSSTLRTPMKQESHSSSSSSSSPSSPTVGEIPVRERASFCRRNQELRTRQQATCMTFATDHVKRRYGHHELVCGFVSRSRDVRVETHLAFLLREHQCHWTTSPSDLGWRWPSVRRRKGCGYRGYLIPSRTRAVCEKSARGLEQNTGAFPLGATCLGVSCPNTTRQCGESQRTFSETRLWRRGVRHCSSSRAGTGSSKSLRATAPWKLQWASKDTTGDSSGGPQATRTRRGPVKNGSRASWQCEGSPDSYLVLCSWRARPAQQQRMHWKNWCRRIGATAWIGHPRAPHGDGCRTPSFEGVCEDPINIVMRYFGNHPTPSSHRMSRIMANINLPQARGTTDKHPSASLALDLCAKSATESSLVTHG